MFKDPKAVKKALFIARQLAASIDPAFTRVPLPEIAKAGGGDAEGLPEEPGTTPIPEGHVRLYHQTSEENIPSILKSGITLSRARGIEGPKAIYADEQGFYGKPGKAPTIEFSVPKERWKPPFVIGDVGPSDIIAHHVPWHNQARYILNDPNIVKEVLSNKHDDLTGDYKKAVDYVKRITKASGGEVDLPMDEASRMARADKAYPQNVFHGTHDVFNQFDPSMVDVGVHVGTARQAENRLKSLSNPFSSGRSNTVRTGANIMPLKTNFGKSLEMEDVGNWKDSEVLSRALEKKGIKVDGLVDEASEVKSQYEDADDWLDSPENRRNLDDLNAALREKGYGSIKYKNLVENEYGERTQLLPAAEKQRALINSEISHIQGKAYERMPKPPENPSSPTADAEMRVFLNSKMENYLQPHEANRIDELMARYRTISDDPKSYDDPNSYIILDTAKLRSRFANFDPKRAHESDLGAATGGFIHDPEKAKRRALMIASGLHKAAGGDVEGDDDKVVPHNLRQQIKETDNPKRIIMPAQGPGGVNGIVVPRHMWEGGNGKHGHMDGMREINKARAQVYGQENRDPLTTGKIAEVHRNALDEHFKKPLSQQIADEKAALNKLRAARHIGENADTLDESEKLDTVRHEHDDKGRTYVAFGSKGVAGHSVYTSGVDEKQKFHALNTCAGATTGCSGGVDKNGFVDTKRGSCFAPNAEAQYPGAAIRRACHAQAKYDPAMTEDWVLAHTGSLRRAANIADKSNKVTLFRPNIVDESDRSSRYVIRHLNKQRAQEGKPNIIANSYSKTTELNDPKNGYFVTYSNTGPKAKLGSSIAENISRDKSRVRSTILATDASGNDLKNEDGEATPPKNSYMVTDVGRYSNLDKNMQKTFTHAKYWSAGRPVSSLSDQEAKEGPEAHYDGSGEPTSPDNAHYGHVVLNDKRYDYQKQHILHPRLVKVGKNKDGSDHLIPTDSRFKDDDYLPKDRFMTRNGKKAGAILLTTPTTSTSSDGHQSSFTHHVDESNIDHALKNNGEYEIDSPEQQESSIGKEYKPPQAAKTYAFGGVVGHDHDNDEGHAFPEQSFFAQRHNAHRSEEDYKASLAHQRTYAYGGPVEGDVSDALALTRRYVKN